MYCNNCGNDTGENRFCQNCGYDVLGGQNENVEKFNLISAYKSMFKKYAQFSGRSRRSEYWYAMFMNTIIIFVFELIMLVPITKGIINNNLSTGETIFTMAGWLIFFLYYLAILIPSLSMTVRRLHDIGKSAWWLLIGFIPYIGSIILFIFSVLDSQPGANKYGPNPKGK